MAAMLIGQHSLQDLIVLYFVEGYKYKTICNFLQHQHEYQLSLRQLKRILKRKGLKRRLKPSISHLCHVYGCILVSNRQASIF